MLYNLPSPGILKEVCVFPHEGWRHIYHLLPGHGPQVWPGSVKPSSAVAPDLPLPLGLRTPQCLACPGFRILENPPMKTC